MAPVITETLQDRAVKMLLCCRDSTLAKEGVQEEIGIASDLAKILQDRKFIIPLRLEPYKKLFGIGELQYIDFVRGWAEGPVKLLATLKQQKVSRNESTIRISPNWEGYRLRGAKTLRNEPERLTSNWLRVASAPVSSDTLSQPAPSTGSRSRTPAKLPAIQAASPISASSRSARPKK